MDDLHARARDLSGALAIAVAALAVCLVVVAVVVGNFALLGVAAVIAILAAVVVLLRRGALSSQVPTPRPGVEAQPTDDPLEAEPVHGHAGPAEDDEVVVGDGGPEQPTPGDEQYQAAAIDARTQLIEAMRKAPVFADDPVRDLDPAMPSGTPGHDAHDSLIDPITGLFSQEFFEVSLPQRVAAARRGLRPMAVAMVDVARAGPAEEPAAIGLRSVGSILQAVFRDSDTIAVSDDSNFLLLFEDTPETGAIWTLERLRRRLAEELPDHVLWAGVCCYPAHALDGPELIRRARAALAKAREWQQGRIEVTAGQAD